MQKRKMAVWGGLTNSCEKKRSERQRRKGKIHPTALSPGVLSADPLAECAFTTTRGALLRFSGDKRWPPKIRCDSGLWLEFGGPLPCSFKCESTAPSLPAPAPALSLTLEGLEVSQHHAACRAASLAASYRGSALKHVQTTLPGTHPGALQAVSSQTQDTGIWRFLLDSWCPSGELRHSDGWNPYPDSTHPSAGVHVPLAAAGEGTAPCGLTNLRLSLQTPQEA